MKVLILGGSGLLGSYLTKKIREKNIKCISHGNLKKADINFSLLNFKDFQQKLDKYNFTHIINCSGLTDVNRNNSNYNLAYRINVISIKNLVKYLKLKKKKLHLIHMSTDQVYNNAINYKPNSENMVCLTNNYSKTKYLGELEAKKNKNTTIIRTNFFGHSYTENKISFSEWLLLNIKKNKKIRLAKNIYFNPINMYFLEKIIFKIIKFKIKGTYNVGSSNYISKYDFGKLVAKMKKISDKNIVSYINDIKKNKRPNGCILNSAKILKKLKIKLPNIQESLKINL